MMKKKKWKVGEVVGRANEVTTAKFIEIAKLRSEAYKLLSSCADAEKRAWESVIRECNLLLGFEYKIIHASGDVMVTGTKEE